VQLGVLAAVEVAVARHQIVRLGLYPCPEAVKAKAKQSRRRHIVVDEILPFGDWFAGKGFECLAELCFLHWLCP
jgi:hypothetical protein